MIAIDVFGGDDAPGAILDGCKLALEQDKQVRLMLAGDENVIERYITANTLDRSRVEVRHAPDIITTHEQPTTAIRTKKNSSLVVALKAVADKEADCMISAGSSGAVLAGATLIVRRIKGVLRPALAPFMPTRKGCILLLDCGANADCKPAYLQQFAVMGSAYYRLTQGVQNPRVGLLNNGAEAEKGNELTKAAYPLLESAPICFVGNCEARDVFTGDYEVVVADGFAGNVLLKNTEGVASLIMGMLKDELMAGMGTKIGAALAKPAFRRLRQRMDYTEYGGALLLGINGGIFKSHGSSDAKAIAATIRQAVAYVKSNVTQAIAEVVTAFDTFEQ